VPAGTLSIFIVYEMQQPRALVTGGAGFIGSHVSEALLSAGYHVTVLDSLVRGSRGNLPEGAEFVHTDVRDPDAAALVRDGAFDLVAHLAAQIDVRASVADPRSDADVNVGGLLNIALAAAEAGVRRFLFASSAGVYAEAGEAPVREGDAKRPVSPYAVSKLAGELYLYALSQTHGLDYVALRFSNVYGPRQDPHGEAGVVAIFCDALASGRALRIYGDGEQTRDYVYVEDVAAAHALLAAAAVPAAAHPDDRAFNVGTGVSLSVNALGEAAAAAAGVPLRAEHHPPRAGEVRDSRLDASRLRALGWAPRTDATRGLGRTFRSLVASSSVAAD
jgi:UDP-glucose 4-epimerase